MRFDGFRRGNRLVHQDDGRILPRQGSWEHGAGGGDLGSSAGEFRGIFLFAEAMCHSIFCLALRARKDYYQLRLVSAEVVPVFGRMGRPHMPSSRSVISVQ